MNRCLASGRLRLIAAFALACPYAIATEPSAPPKDASALAAATARALDEIAQLEEVVAQQQEQLRAVQARLAALRNSLPAADGESTPGATAQSTAPHAALEPSAAAPKGSPAGRPAPQDAATAEPSPLQLRLGSATIMPVGFMDLTNTFRSTNAGTSLQTNFGSIPYSNTTAGRLTENKLSAANSRIGFRVDAAVKGAHVIGYYEGDFVGGVADTAYNTQVSSNSLLYRIRLYWVDVRKHKLEFLAGQSWSMMTPNRRQISPLPADLFYSQAYDVNYVNGLTWGRIPGMRVLYHPSEKVTLGFSVENSSQYFGGSGGGGLPTLPSALATPMASELDQNVSNGVKIPTLTPDFIGKIAFDPSKRLHFELAGVQSSVRLYNPTTQTYFAKAGGGGSINVNVEVAPGLRLVSNNFWSDGDGRYLFGVAPNFIVRADGSPSFIHSGSTVSGFEYTHKNSLLYAYYGGIYIGRNTALDANGRSFIGYGYAGSPNSQNKTTQEGTIGLTQTIWRDARYGALQTMFEYAYFFRNPWSVAPGAPASAHESAVWFNMRYQLPGGAPSVEH